MSTDPKKRPDGVRPGQTIDWDAWLKPPPADQPQPKFVCEAAEIDLGKLWATGWQPVKGWRFRNEGEAPLRLLMRHSCCTNPIDSNEMTIPPGESRQVKLKVLVYRQSQGSRTFHASVRTNDASNPKIKLRATCAILNAVHLNPRVVKVEDFDRSIDQLTETITILRAHGGPIRPSVMPDQLTEWITARIHEIKPGEHYELTITATRPWPANGSLSAQVRLSTGVQELPERKIAVFFHTQPRMTCEPRGFWVPPRSRKAGEQLVTLSWSADRPAPKVLAVSTNVPELTAHLNSVAGNTVVILKNPAGVDLSETRNMKVTLRTDDPDFPELTIPIAREGRRAPYP